jgi:putative spermidine/putrescine transport system substrate-binding protein
LLRRLIPLLSLIAATLLPLSGQASAQTVVCYNCPPEWADWARQIAAIQQRLGIAVPFDNKNSGQALAQIIAEKASPVADVTYLGVTFGIEAKKQGLVAPYRPAGIDQVPAGLKDADGAWFAIHSGTLGLMVNVDALAGKPVPQSWADLLKPDYKGMVGYLDPTSAFVGFAGAMAINQALGGSLDNVAPAIGFFQALAKNDPIVPKQTAYARVLSGEIPIMLDYDFSAYRAKYKDGANVAFVIPREGTLSMPYVMALVKGAPHEADARKVLDFTLSDEGQALWAQAFLRPTRPVALPPEVAARFLPEAEYARVHTIDYGRMAEIQKAFADRYQAEVH